MENHGSLKIVLILVSALFCACSGIQEARQVRSSLDKAETRLSTQPDHSLAMLRSINPETLKTRKDRARAALLHSIALDKCFIDICSDSILAQAIIYYTRHGSADQRLKTRYYQSVLARNAGDLDEEMMHLLQAEENESKAKDKTTIGMLHAAKRIVFMRLYDLEHAAQEGFTAVEAFREAGDNIQYLNVVLDLANLYQMQDITLLGSEMLDTIRCHWSELSVKQKSKYYSISILFENREDACALLSEIDDYLTEIPSNQINWINLTDAYLAADCVEKAAEAFNFVRTESQEQEAAYYLVQSRLLKAQGNDAGAIEAYRTYSQLTMQRVIPYIGNNPESDLAKDHLLADCRTKSGYIWFLLFLFVLVACVSFIVIREKSRQVRLLAIEKSVHELNEKITEQELMKAKDRLLRKEEEGKPISEKTRNQVAHSLEILNKYRYYVWRNDPEEAERYRAKLIDKNGKGYKEFIGDVLTQFEYTHPYFVTYLEDSNLTTKELQMCCCICLDFRVPEISVFMNITESYQYKLRSRIRRKIGATKRNEKLEDCLHRLAGTRHLTSSD